jgi:urease accessory protein
MRAHRVVAAGGWDTALETDEVLLDFDARFRRRIVLPTTGGASVALDLPHAVRLRDGDGLLLDNGGIVRVRACDEPVLDIAAPTELLMRIAWHLGNRHLPVQFVEGALRIREDHVMAHMVEGLGASVLRLDAPFDPEPGAYAAGGHHHHADDDDHAH